MLARLLLIAITALYAVPALAWGPDGHAIVAEIAQNRLTPEAQKKVSEMLNGAPLASIASWADEVRFNRRETSRWHFVNFAEGTTGYVPERDCAEVQGQGDCIIAAIARAQADLKSPNASQVEALKFLVHFVGDIHQPLHAVGTELGGNRVRVTFFGDRTNLHAVWDTGLIQRTGRTYQAYARYLESVWLKDKDANALSRGTPIEWALSSRAIGEAALVPQEAALGSAYSVKYEPVVDQQLALAGIRLAKMLNDSLQ